jgi:hypothetical protein
MKGNRAVEKRKAGCSELNTSAYWARRIYVGGPRRLRIHVMMEELVRQQVEITSTTFLKIVRNRYKMSNGLHLADYASRI